MPAKKTAKVFWTGRSQAVRLPKEFRFDSETVSVRREGQASFGQRVLIARLCRVL
jgi:virulence-associated protein VagC